MQFTAGHTDTFLSIRGLDWRLSGCCELVKATDSYCTCTRGSVESDTSLTSITALYSSCCTGTPPTLEVISFTFYKMHNSAPKFCLDEPYLKVKCFSITKNSKNLLNKCLLYVLKDQTQPTAH